MPSLISRPARRRPIPEPTPYGLHVRHLYMNERLLKTGDRQYSAIRHPRWDGGIDDAGVRWTVDHWSRLAALIMHIGTQPDDYLRFQFEGCSRVPLPDELARPDAVEAYRGARSREGRREQLQMRLAGESNQLHTEVVIHLAWGERGWSAQQAARYELGFQGPLARPFSTRSACLCISPYSGSRPMMGILVVSVFRGDAGRGLGSSQSSAFRRLGSRWILGRY